METVAWLEVINNTLTPVFFYMCNAFQCVQSTIFLSWWSRKGKDNAEQEANYKSIKITEENSKKRK